METSSTTSIALFSVFTLIYIIIKQLLGFEYNDPGERKRLNIFLGIYIIAILGCQYALNSKLTKDLCGTVQTKDVVLFTLVPNFFIFGILILLFSYFPGWKAPFSNTFGYLGTWIGGIRGVFNKMLLFNGKSEEEIKQIKKTLSKKTRKLIKQVYDDPSLMINQFTPQNFNTIIERMEPVTVQKRIKNKDNVFETVTVQKDGLLNKNADKYYAQLYKLVTLKDSIAEWWWYMLTGTLVILTSYNAMLDISCTKSTAAMLEQHKQWEDEQNNVKPPPTPKTYKTRE